MVKTRENTHAHNVHQYLVVGRAQPTEKKPTPKIYKMRIFANDEVRAKSKFWYFLKRLNKVKKAVGEILSCNEIFEKDPTKVKTFGIVCTYKSKFGYHTLYKEFRSLTLNGAVNQLYSEMAGRHKAQRESLVIIRTTEITGDVAKEAKRNYSSQVAKEGIKFPLLQRKLRPYRKSFKTVFKASRPNLFA